MLRREILAVAPPSRRLSGGRPRPPPRGRDASGQPAEPALGRVEGMPALLRQNAVIISRSPY